MNSIETKIMLFGIDVKDRELVFDCLGSSFGNGITIDKLLIESNHVINCGWSRISIIDHPIYMGPFEWLSRGGLNLTIGPYENFKVEIKIFDENDKWFHGSMIHLKAYKVDGSEIEIEYKKGFDCYIK